MAHDVAQHKHTHADAAGCDERGAAHFQQLLETEFESQGEQQEDDADFGPLLHGFRGRDAEQAQVRAHNETGDDIAQDERLFERLGDNGKDAGGDQDNGQVFYQIQFFSHILYAKTGKVNKKIVNLYE